MANTEKGAAFLDAHIAKTAPRRYLIDVNAPVDAKVITQVELYDDAVKRLAALPSHEYDRTRAQEAKPSPHHPVL